MESEPRRFVPSVSEDRRWFTPLRRDPLVRGCVVSFAFFGVAGLLDAAGIDVPEPTIYAAVLLVLGAAGLWSVLRAR